MDRIIHVRMEDVDPERCDGRNGYGYTERNAVPGDLAKRCQASFYELPSGRSNYPYHYHLEQEEIFYIVRGEGVVKTPEGERPVKAGDMLYFPAGPGGAHRLTNTSGSETMVYIDFDATPGGPDVAVYPDSGKIGVWSRDLNRVYRLGDGVDYYEGE